ncbi:Speckle-type POZ protein [Araneus ventricosus]|uniref:Speckle-type POZ protein n=1 Tax=Araneus ventricosus TaxID=182803 RepID=A0A4Y2R9U3_ARAVE|nr:Speckle-type POZ protein [Araneus ventricosus]
MVVGRIVGEPQKRMANREKCFTFLWVLKNADFCWQQQKERIESNSFVVDEIEGTKWKLWLYPRGILTENVALFLIRDEDTTGADYVKIEYDLAFLDSGKEVLKSVDKDKKSFHKDHRFMDFPTVSQSDEFGDKIPKFVTNNMITVRCRIWKCVGEFSDSVTCVSCNRIFVERSVTAWRIENFSTLDAGKNCIHEIKSVRTREHLMSLELLPDKLNSGEFQCDITPRKRDIKSCKLTFFPSALMNLDRSVVPYDIAYSCVQGFFVFDVPGKPHTFKTQPFFMKRLMEYKQVFLSNDVLSLECTSEFCYGVVQEESIFTCEINVEKILEQNASVSEDNPCSSSSSGLNAERPVVGENPVATHAPDSTMHPIAIQLRKNRAHKVYCPSSDVTDSDEDEMNDKLVRHHFSDFIKDFTSMMDDEIHSDVKLRTRSKIYPAHKCVLSARSPVFRAMFLNNARENANDCIDIKDLRSNAVKSMLLYMYRAEIPISDGLGAYRLYIAAAKYELLVLKDICASFLKKYMSMKNAFEICLLADQHRDDDLKDFAQDFIARSGLETKYWCRARFRRAVKEHRLSSSAAKNEADSDSEYESDNDSVDDEQFCTHINTYFEDFKALMKCGVHSDIKLRASGKIYPAHKCILSARSPVFKARLERENTNDCVDIKGLNDDTVCRMLRYIYTGEVGELRWDGATRLYAAAQEYEFPILISECLFYFKRHMRQSNTREVMQLVQRYRDARLKEIVAGFILKNMEDFQKTGEFKQLVLEAQKSGFFDSDDSD